MQKTMQAKMRAMILAAGRGERLKPLTDVTPKPMLNVRGRPLLAHQLDWLTAAGITEVVINLHHLGEQIENCFADGAANGIHIRYSREAEPLETGGGIVKALPLLGSDPFLIINGDIYTDFPLTELVALPAWADMHLLLTPTPAFREHGDFDYADGKVTGRGDGYVYCGIAIMRPELFRDRPVARFSIQGMLFDAAANGRLSAQVWQGYWTDIGTEDQLNAVNESGKT